MSLLFRTLAFLAVPVLPSIAQVSFGGRPLGWSSRQELPPSPTIVMPPVDAEAMIAEDEARIATGIKAPFRFGVNHAVDLSLENSGTWHELPNGDRVWRITLECPEAYSINFEFHDYFIPEGARVFAYTDSEFIGAFTMESSGGQESMGVTQLAGDRITIEYDEPATVRGRGRLRIGQVTHAYRDLFLKNNGFGASGNCNRNVICPEGDPWRDQIRSVAMITVNGSGVCTGQLINNCEQDGTPFFLTARHCYVYEGQSVSNWVYRFNWESPTCTPSTNVPANQTVSGSSMLVHNANTDVALIRFNAPVPESYDVYYSGWDRSMIAPTSSFSVHHPSGDLKKIAVDDHAAGSATWGGAPCWHVLTWEVGTTEGGSSGAGLWNQNGLLVGQLYGGAASCAQSVSDYYAKFGSSYPVLRPWLGNCGSQLGGYPNVVGIEEPLDEGHDLSLYPNPTTGTLEVVVPEKVRRAPARLTLRDALGRTIMERAVATGTERAILDLGDRSSGIYLLELEQNGLRMMERVVLDR